MAHYEPPHQDLRCLKIQPFLSLAVKELMLMQLLIVLVDMHLLHGHWLALSTAQGGGLVIPVCMLLAKIKISMCFVLC